jgi:hypothetical protein
VASGYRGGVHTVVTTTSHRSASGVVTSSSVYMDFCVPSVDMDLVECVGTRGCAWIAFDDVIEATQSG